MSAPCWADLIQRAYDAITCRTDSQAGLAHFFHVGWSELALHAPENVGDTKMIFSAVELNKESENAPLATASSWTLFFACR